METQTGRPRHALMLAFASAITATLAIVSTACGGATDDGGNPPAAGPTVLTSKEGSDKELIPGSNLFDSTPTPGDTSATPTPTPPPLTADETQTSILVDKLSYEEYPRTSARDLEAEFRHDPGTAASLIGQKRVVKGQVRIADRDAGGNPYVTLVAGAGGVTCWFTTITESELRRMTPGGTNAVVGTLSEWDPDNREVTVRDCQLVKGY